MPEPEYGLKFETDFEVEGYFAHIKATFYESRRAPACSFSWDAKTWCENNVAPGSSGICECDVGGDQGDVDEARTIAVAAALLDIEEDYMEPVSNPLSLYYYRRR